MRCFPKPAVDVIAHRGASAYAAENTLAAHDLALEQGADVLELDVRVTADGALVVAHDETLLRTIGDPRRVDELTAAQIAGLDAPGRPVTLDDVLGRYGRRTRYLVDLKSPTPAWEARVLDALERHDVRDLAVVQSFDHAALRRIRAAASWVTLTALYRREEDPRENLARVASFATGVGPWHGSIDAAFVAEAGACGLIVRPWTVDEPDEIARILGLGVAGVITNAPDVARSVLHQATALPAAA